MGWARPGSFGTTWLRPKWYLSVCVGCWAVLGLVQGDKGEGRNGAWFRGVVKAVLWLGLRQQVQRRWGAQGVSQRPPMLSCRRRLCSEHLLVPVPSCVLSDNTGMDRCFDLTVCRSHQSKIDLFKNDVGLFSRCLCSEGRPHFRPFPTVSRLKSELRGFFGESRKVDSRKSVERDFAKTKTATLG